ncbi:MAG: putative transporter ATP-binding protein [Acidimicrobiia bacterium]|nr:putative transporter ATP-binding protein [Acidimicrobiia bacterium]
MVVADATFSVRPGDKVGLVGRNGAGKTSLLRVLGGSVPANAGTVTVKGSLGYLSQDPRISSELEASSALSHVLSGRGFAEALIRMEKLRLAVEEEPSDRNIERYSRAEEMFRHEGGYGAESEVRSLCAGLGLHPDRVDLPIGVLSGGERRRVELARILFAGSEVLLLDEPTNHLDVDAKNWIMKFLRTYKGALVVISHDLDLLDESITRVLHLDRATEEASGHVVEYRGTYSQYQGARAKDEVLLVKTAARQAAEIDRLQKVVDRFGAKASKASMAHSIEKRIDRLSSAKVEAPRHAKQIAVKFPPPPHSGRMVLDVSKLTKSYGGPAVFKDVAFDVGRGERVLVLGLNGAGKTSLLRILAGQTMPDQGQIDFGMQVSTGYFAQEHETIESESSLIENLKGSVLGLKEHEMRGLLGMFGLSGDKAFQSAGTLSGGERTKLALAMLMGGKHNLLLLDEPTNNLDPPSRTAVADALSTWPGSMVIVSHDAEFVERLSPNRVLLMPDGDLDHWSNDLLDLVALA